MAKRFPLANGASFLVDDEDVRFVLSVGWAASGGEARYVGRCVKRNGKWTTEYLHRVIARAPEGTEVDHINGDTLDNRRSNLRIVSRGENERAKTQAKGDSRTGVRGVTWLPRRHRWIAYYYERGRCRQLGSFVSLAEAEHVASLHRREMLAHLRPVGGAAS